MKRWICIFMVCAMLCALLPAAAFAITPETDTPETTTHEPILPETDDPVIDEAAIAQGLAYAQEHPELVHELSAPEEVSSTSPAVRGSAEDNLVMPAPLMEGMGCSLRQSGKGHRPRLHRNRGRMACKENGLQVCAAGQVKPQEKLHR